MTTTYLAPSLVDSYDYVVVGGGTAGCVVASRLAEYLPTKRILLVEAGPSDFMDNRVLDLRQWLSLLGGDLDYDYGTTEQPMGNSHIRHSRAKVLGGCSSHNTLISFRPFEFDLRVWQSMGATGWTFPVFMRALDRLRNTVQRVHSRHRNQLCKDWVAACSTAMDIPVIHDFNAEILERGALRQGVGFFSVSYNPDTGHRSSASVAYLHPILRGEEARPNLTILTEAWVSKINVRGDDVEGVDITLKDGSKRTVRAQVETVLCAGAVDTPRLMLLSGMGPRAQLEALGIPVVRDIPGVGENLQDHPETIIIFELNKPVPPNQTTMDSDAGIFLRRESPDADKGRPSPANPAGLPDGDIADVMMHCYQIPFTLNTARLGYDVPQMGYAFCMTPNVPRPRSRGCLYLTSADPQVKPALDFRYFTDPEGYDAATFVHGIKAARRIAQQEPFASWLVREVAPGPQVQTDAEISEYARRAAHTVYHPVGTTRLGLTNGTEDPLAVVDARLRVRGLSRLRIADAGVFPTIPTINPMLTVLGVAERCAEMLVEDANCRGAARLALLALTALSFAPQFARFWTDQGIQDISLVYVFFNLVSATKQFLHLMYLHDRGRALDLSDWLDFAQGSLVLLLFLILFVLCLFRSLARRSTKLGLVVLFVGLLSVTVVPAVAIPLSCEERDGHPVQDLGEALFLVGRMLFVNPLVTLLEAGSFLPQCDRARAPSAAGLLAQAAAFVLVALAWLIRIPLDTAGRTWYEWYAFKGWASVDNAVFAAVAEVTNLVARHRVAW